MDTSYTPPPLAVDRFEQLPDDVLIHILSFLLTLAEKCRNTTLLDFEPSTLLLPSDPNWDDRMHNSHTWYISWVNNVIDSRATAAAELPLVKHLLIQYYKMNQDHQHHIHKWINFAIANRVETLHLDFHYTRSKQFLLSEKLWYTAPSGLSSIKCLKSLFLSSINFSKQFVDFILSSCPLLEELALERSTGTFTHLDVSSVPPLRLKRLKIHMNKDFVLNTLCVPCLTSFYHQSPKFSPQMIHVPMLTDLTIGGPSKSPPITVCLEPFRRYLPQLKKLELVMSRTQDFKFMQLPELVTLRYLKMEVIWDLDPIFFEVIKFIKLCPLLETFALLTYYRPRISSRPQPSLEPEQLKNKQKWYRELEENCVFKSLKKLELYGVNEITIEHKVIECIIIKSPKLEKLTLDTRSQVMLCSRPETVKVVKAKVDLWCQGRHPEIHIKVID